MRARCVNRAGSMAVALAVFLSVAVNAQAQTTPALPRLFLEDTLAGESGGVTNSGPVVVGARISVGGLGDLPPVDRYLDAAAAAAVPVWLAVDAPRQLGDVAEWRAHLRTLAARPSPPAIVEIVFAGHDAELQRFVIEVSSTEVRAANDRALIALGASDAPGLSNALRRLRADQAPYVDLIAIDSAWTSEIDPSLRTARAAIPSLEALTRSSATDPVVIVRNTLRALGTDTIATAWAAPPATMAAAAVALAPAANLLVHPVEVLEPGSVGLVLTPQPAASAAPYSRLLFDAESFATYLTLDGGPAASMVTIDLRIATAGRPALHDLSSGRSVNITQSTRDEAEARTVVTVPVTGGPMLVDFSAGVNDIVVDRASVTAARTLSVAEVIARHRRQQARQDALLKTYRASARMEQHFRPSLTDPGYDVLTENDFFVEGKMIEWEELSFSVNGSKWGADRPAFPLLQAEKVLSLPLDLRLDEDYRYELSGFDSIDGVECYRVRFEPISSSVTLYKGTVWIDRVSFAKLRVQAVQTSVSPPIVSNEEILDYRPVGRSGNVPLYALTQQSARQIVLIAGRNLLLEKASRFANFQINDDRFAEWRAAARAGERIMYRDTDQGLRYLVKEGGQRVVSNSSTTSAKAMAIGVLIDPSYAFTVPIFGINYLDFELRGRQDTQLAILFGGVFAAGNVQRSRLGRSVLDASVDFFGIAVPSSDRLYLDSGEQEAERLLSWPSSIGANLGWQATAFQKVTAQYQLRFDPFVRDRTTAESYVVPSSTTTNGVGGTWEYRRGGYSAVANGTWFARSSWKPWGPQGAVQATPRTYVKYAAHLTKDVFLGTFQKIHVNGAFFGGSRLDRFSRYQFGLFDDTRIHGMPGAGVRFDALGMVRLSYSFNVFEQYRLDLFADRAWGRDDGAARTWQPLTGFGIAANLRAPFNTILRADIGKSLLPTRYARIGSVIGQIMILKPLK